MNIELFKKIVENLGDRYVDDFSYEHEGKTYAFKKVGDNSWDDEGKYQYKTESGQLIEINKKYKEVQSFNFGVSRSIQRSGSYFSEYDYEKDPYEMYEIVDVLIPEVIIPAHVESKWNEIKD